VNDWEETGSLDAIQLFFYTTLLEVPRARAGRGCMMVNTLLELADVDPELSVLAERKLARIESVFEDCFEQAQQTGDYTRDRSARDLAAHVMVMNQGLRVASRKRVPRSELKRDIDSALSLLGLSVPA
jgi:TetR/AcrR family transcriptional repressor of nem operon